MLKWAHEPLAFCNLSQQGSGLGNEQVLVVGDKDDALNVEDLSLATVHPHTGQSLLIERPKLFGRNCQQVGMPGRYQRAYQPFPFIRSSWDIILDPWFQLQGYPTYE